MATRNVSIGVLRARHTDDALVPDSAYLELLNSPTSKESITDYFRDTTQGYVNFTFTLLPPVDISLSDDDMGWDKHSAELRQGIMQQTWEHAYAATRAVVPDLEAYDGYVAFINPGQVKRANAAFGHPVAAGKPPEPPEQVTAVWGGYNSGFRGLVISVQNSYLTGSEHGIICHELAHLVGIQHSYGPQASLGSSEGAYGDPYDIMGEGGYFVGTPVPGWPSDVHSRMGPAIALAQLHHWDVESLGPAIVADFPIPAPGTSHSVWLRPADSTTPGTQLLTIDPATPSSVGQGRVYIEYRAPRGWDRGLKPTGLWSSGALVCHTVDPIAQSSLPACWYRWAIPLPVTGASAGIGIPGTPLSVRVLEFDATDPLTEPSVLVSIDGAPNPGLTLVEASYTVTPQPPAIEVVETSETPCGDTVELLKWPTSTEVSCQAFYVGADGISVPKGLGDDFARLTWVVGGTVVAPQDQSVTISVPGPAGAVDLRCYANSVGGSLSISAGVGVVAHVPVVVTVASPAGPEPRSASVAFAADGFRTGYNAEDHDKIVACLRSQVRKAIDRTRLWPPGSVIPRHRFPEPPAHLGINNRVLFERLRDITGALSVEDPPAADALARVTAMHFGQLWAPR